MIHRTKEVSSLYVGLMSGTSMDGIDAVVLDVKHQVVRHGLIVPYRKRTREHLEHVLHAPTSDYRDVYALHLEIGEDFARAVETLLEAARIDKGNIAGVGSHGQTVYHAPQGFPPMTIQLGCAHTIAARTGLTVVADFRARDIVLGGEGAPFAPVYHAQLFQSYEKPLAVVNLGGIANLTWLGLDGEVRGYDLGPGNALLDAWVKHVEGKDYDENGALARAGQIQDALLNALCADPFFKKPSPKSIDKAYFNLAWLEQRGQLQHNGYRAADVQATLVALTATTLKEAIAMEAIQPKRVMLCGGGVHNSALFEAVEAVLSPLPVASTAIAQIDPDYVEAAMFAWMAHETLSGRAMDIGSVTGAQTASILGAVYF